MLLIYVKTTVCVCECAALSSFLEVCFDGLRRNVKPHVFIGSLHCQIKIKTVLNLTAEFLIYSDAYM